MTDRVSGKCLCGACHVSLVPSRDEMHVCHCDMCRAWTGLGMMALPVTSGTLDISGPVKRRATSDWAERGWCDDCGSGLFYHVTAEGMQNDFYSVPSGLFANAGGAKLVGEFFTDRRPAGYAFAGDLNGMTETETLAYFGGDG